MGDTEQSFQRHIAILFALVVLLGTSFILQPSSLLNTTSYPEAAEIQVDGYTEGEGMNWTNDTRITYEPALSSQPNLAVSGENVHVVWTDNRHSPHYVYAIPPYDIQKTVTYSIFTTDYASNFNTTSNYSFEVTAQDTIPPEIEHEPSEYRLIGHETVIEARVTDNSQVESVYLNYVDVVGSKFNITMNLYIDDPRYYSIYRATIPPQADVGTITYSICAMDAEGIANVTDEHNISVLLDDSKSPIINHSPSLTKVIGYEVLIEASVVDDGDVEIVGLNYTDVDGEAHNVDMFLRENRTYSFGIPPQPHAGTLTYSIYARDSDNNTNRSSLYSIQIVSVDKELPTIAHKPIENAVVGYWIPVHAFALDNLGMGNSVKLRIDGGDITMGRLSTGGVERLYYRRSTDGGMTWDDGLGHIGVDRPLTHVSWAARPQIAVEGENIHIVFKRGDPRGLYYLVSRDNGATWSDSQMLADGGGYGGYGDVVVHGDSVYVVWVNADIPVSSGRLHLSLSTDGGRTWKYRGELNQTLAADSIVQTALDGRFLHVITGEYDTPNLRYMRGAWDGNEFFWDDGRGRAGEARIVAVNDVPWYPPETYAVSASGGSVHLVYRNLIPHYTRKLWCDGFTYDFWTPYHQLGYVNSLDNGRTWSTSSPTVLVDHSDVPWDSNQCDPLYPFDQGHGIWDTDIVFDGTAVHVAWSDTRDDNSTYEVYYKTGDAHGLNWSDDFRLTHNVTYQSSSISIDEWDGTVHVTWKDNRDKVQLVNANYTGEIYYKRLPLVPSITSPKDILAELEGNAQENVNVTWSRSPDDIVGPNPVLQYELYYSTYYNRAGSGYQLLTIINANGSDAYHYVHQGAGNGDPNSYFYRVIAVGVDGLPASCMTQVAKYTRWLTSGMQLVSIPLELKENRIDDVFQTLNYSSIWHYDSTARTWDSCHSAKPYCFFPPVDRSMAFWVNVSQDGYMTVAGVVPSITWVSLEQGWNLIGYPSFLNDSSADVFAGLKVSRSETYEGASLPFNLRLLSVTGEMKAGEGYWVYSQVSQRLFLSN